MRNPCRCRDGFGASGCAASEGRRTGRYGISDTKSRGSIQVKHAISSIQSRAQSGCAAQSTTGPQETMMIYKTSIRSEEHTSELQSLMRISYAVFCLKKKTKHYYKH